MNWWRLFPIGGNRLFVFLKDSIQEPEPGRIEKKGGTA
nr:MAG TPA: hypothetical protein [Caudoviricetes sp.]